MNDESTPRVVLTIAGTDPSGAAGIQVDLQVFRDHGLHGASVVTAVLWQNTAEVRGFRALEPREVGAQIDAVLDDIPIGAVKIGMVPNEAIALEIVSRLENVTIPIIVDTVFSSGSGNAKLTHDAPRNVSDLLLPISTIATPNALEAAQIIGREVTVENALEVALEIRSKFGPEAVLLKAGHIAGDDQIRDVFADISGAHWMNPLERIDDDVRGTGCQLSSAIASQLVLGTLAEEACEKARSYLNDLLVNRRRMIGKGRKVIVRAR